MRPVGTTMTRSSPLRMLFGGTMQHQQSRRLGRRRGAFFAIASVAALAAGLATWPAQAQRADAGDWIGTWAASPQPVWDADFFAPVGIPRALRNQTIRQIVRVSIGGSR